MTNSDSAALDCASRPTVRSSGPGSRQPSSAAASPAARPSTNGLRHKPTATPRSTARQWPPPLALSANASSSGMSSRFSTSMFMPRITPAVGPPNTNRLIG